MADTMKHMKIVIILLSILLVLSLTALVCVILYGHMHPANGSAVIPDNYIEPAGSIQPSAQEKIVRAAPNSSCVALSHTVITGDSTGETEISLYKNHTGDSAPFHCPNLFPGDSETQRYLLSVSHKATVTVCFHADIRPGYEQLAEVLKCRIALDGGEVLYDGLMRDMPESLEHSLSAAGGVTSRLCYEITVYLDTGVGNAYMDQTLVADWRWWVAESGELIDPPLTGDRSHFCIWFWVAMISLAGNVILLLPKDRQCEDTKEDDAANG